MSSSNMGGFWSNYKLLISISGLIICFVVLPLIFLYTRITKQNAEKYSAIGSILLAIVGIPTLFFLGYQTMQLKRSVDIQSTQNTIESTKFDLEQRPYVYLKLNKLSVTPNQSEGGWFGGGDLQFINVGKEPATILQTDYMVASDIRGKIDFVKWFKEAYGDFPDIKTVFPGQEDASVPCHPLISSLNPRPKMLYVAAVISYTGSRTKKVYWYKFSQLYIIAIKETKASDGAQSYNISLYPYSPDHEWDRNAEQKAPVLAVPNWQKYLSKDYVRHVTKENNSP